MEKCFRSRHSPAVKSLFPWCLCTKEIVFSILLTVLACISKTKHPLQIMFDLSHLEVAFSRLAKFVFFPGAVYSSSFAYNCSLSKGSWIYDRYLIFFGPLTAFNVPGLLRKCIKITAVSTFQGNRKPESTEVAINKDSTGLLNFQPTQTKRKLRIFQYCQK